MRLMVLLLFIVLYFLYGVRRTRRTLWIVYLFFIMVVMMLVIIIIAIILYDFQVTLNCSLLTHIVGYSKVEVILTKWSIDRDIDVLVKLSIAHTNVLTCSV